MLRCPECVTQQVCNFYEVCCEGRLEHPEIEIIDLPVRGAKQDFSKKPPNLNDKSRFAKKNKHKKPKAFNHED